MKRSTDNSYESAEYACLAEHLDLLREEGIAITQKLEQYIGLQSKLATLEYEISALQDSIEEHCDEDVYTKLSSIDEESSEIMASMPPIVNKFVSYQNLLQKNYDCGEESIRLATQSVTIMDPTMKEEYLDEEEFQRVFTVSKREFRTMPRWKREAKKREVHLF